MVVREHCRPYFHECASRMSQRNHARHGLRCDNRILDLDLEGCMSETKDAVEEMSVSEMMQEGTLCIGCGVYDNWDAGDGFPRFCDHCASDLRKEGGHRLTNLSIGGFQHTCERNQCPWERKSK